MFTSSALLLLASGLVAATANDELVVRQLNALTPLEGDLAKRAALDSPASSSYLSEIFGMVTDRCEKTCNVGLGDLSACSKLSTQATIAACACSSITLGDLRSCASCVSTTTKSTANATEVVNSYNSFVDLCSNEGLARVTGTVEVGASTRPISRSSTSSASTALSVSTIPSSASSRATYNPSSAPASTATVPSLVATGAIASSARVAAASASPSGTSGAGRVVASLSAVGALVGAVAFLA